MNENPLPRAYPWRLFFLLLLAADLSVLAAWPYIATLLAPILASHPLKTPLPIPLPALMMVQGTINFGIATLLGLYFARKVGLGAPLLENWVYRAPAPPHRPVLLPAIIIGIVAAVIILALGLSPFGEGLRHLSPVPEASVALWKRFLVCFYGAFGEEILMRLFVLSALLWLGQKLLRFAPRHAGLFWTMNLLAAIAFGAGHLPFAATLGPLTPMIVVAVISLNSIAGLGFGYLYWSRGLEAAIVAHFSADIVLHVIGPILG